MTRDETNYFKLNYFYIITLKENVIITSLNKLNNLAYNLQYLINVDDT